MPKNKAGDPVTDQEITFARLVLSGTMTDRDAAQTAGLHPSTAAYTKTRPRVRAYLLEHRAAVEQPIVQQSTEALRPLDNGREQVLARLWHIANLSPQMTRGSLTGQVKAIAMIIAIQGLIPDRRTAGRPEKPSAAPPAPAPFYKAAWLREQEQPTTQAESKPAPAKKTIPHLPIPNPLPVRRQSLARPPPPTPSPPLRPPGKQLPGCRMLCSTVPQTPEFRSPSKAIPSPGVTKPQKAQKASNFIEFYRNCKPPEGSSRYVTVMESTPREQPRALVPADQVFRAFSNPRRRQSVGRATLEQPVNP